MPACFPSGLYLPGLCFKVVFSFRVQKLLTTWIIEETGLETIGHVQCIVHADWLRAFFNVVEPSGNL